jgi:hypothetical protein
MQVGPDSGARDTWNDYLERYAAWNNALPHETLPNVYRNPDLVQNIYIWDTNLGTVPRLFRLSAETKKVEAVEVPKSLETLLTRLRANSSSLSTSLRVWQLPDLGTERRRSDSGASNLAALTTNTGWQFDENVPAIVHPIFQRDGKSLSSQSPVDWMVIVLDLNALRKRILPELAARYFGGLEGLEYKVAVVANGPKPQIIYSSDAGFGAQGFDTADAGLNIFGPPLESTAGGVQLKGKNARSLRSTEWHHFYGSTWFPVIQYEAQTDPWILVLQHRAGPLQAVISRVRQRNVAIGGFLLALLALNMALLTIASIRAQNFTKLQMDFVASVSHELRTPLTTIFSAAENIKDGVVRDKAGLADYGSIVMGQSRQLMDHVDRILLFASMRSGKDRYNLRPLLVPEVLQRVRRNVAALIIEESFTIEEVIEPDFEPFYRSPEAVMAQIPGTGLGLSVSKHLAEAMGGALSVQSEVGVGSIFTVHLQIADSQVRELVNLSSSTNGVTKNE